MPSQGSLDDAGLRKMVEAVLAQSPQTQLVSIGSAIARESQASQQSAGGYVPITSGSPQVSQRDLGRIQDLLWDLIIEGHLRPGLGDGMNNDLPFVHVTEKGKNYFRSS